MVTTTKSKFTRTEPLSLTWRAVPKVTYVLAGSGRGRYLLVYNCGHCRQRHVAHARVLKAEMKRRTACKIGVIVLLTDQAQVAA